MKKGNKRVKVTEDSHSEEEGEESNLERRRKAARAKDRISYASRRDDLLASAAAVFNEAEYDGATLTDIARRAGMDRASLYYYASSKEELFEQVCSGMLDANLRAAEEIASCNLRPCQKLRLIIEHHVVTNTRDNPQWGVLIHQMRRVSAAGSVWSRGVVDKMRRYEGVVRTIIVEGVAESTITEEVSPDLAVHAIFGMLNWTHRWFSPDGEFGAEQISRTFVGIALDGLAARPS